MITIYQVPHPSHDNETPHNIEVKIIMASHNELGKEGEELAAKWLVKKGYTLLHRNWRHRYHEIDIVATSYRPGKPEGRQHFLHFVEVKVRNESPFGLPEDSVTRKKFRHLKNAADEYLFQNPGYRWIQYDVLAITFRKNKEIEYFLIEDVFL
ncbi:MAG TPA: YraN family protein [Chitinophagaceae bacterium]|nr:YraN family protein [Chitinophagaceae bacterium]